MTRTIAIASQKGGVGKTTTAANLAGAAGVYGRRVLAIDFDPQFALTRALGQAPSQAPGTICELLAPLFADDDAPDLEDLVVDVGGGVTLLAGNRGLAAHEQVMGGDRIRAHTYLADALKGQTDTYDVVLIDCPPNLGLLTLNALCAADELLVPLAMNDTGALQGARETQATLLRAKEKLGARAEIRAMVPTRWDPCSKAHQLNAESLAGFDLPLTDVVIPRRNAFNTALALGKPLVWYRRSHEGASAYRDLARELKVA